jgi:hypothetical protein
MGLENDYITEPISSDDLKETLLNRDWLMSKTREELIDLVMMLAEQMVEGGGTHAPLSGPGGTRYIFPEVKEEDIVEFISVPLKIKTGKLAKPWRVILVSSDSSHEPLGLDIKDDVIIGRKRDSSDVDLDLSGFNAQENGVSRMHAAIRASMDELVLYDLGSSNGTYKNGRKIDMGTSLPLEDGDVIAFGLLQFMVKIVRGPGSVESQNPVV